MTPLTERNMLPQRGASFFRDPGGEVLFQFVVDTSNVIGPRPMTKADREKHPAAWDAFDFSTENVRWVLDAPVRDFDADMQQRLAEAEREEAGGDANTGAVALPEQVTGQPEAPRRKTLRLKAS